MALTVGDVLAFSVTIRDENGVLANAGNVTLAVTHPDGTAYAGSPFPVVPTTTGVYEKTDLLATMAGRYVGKWIATGINASAHTQVFHIRTGDETALVSLDEVKDHLNIPLTTTTHDQELERKIGSATGVVERFCGPVARRSYIDEVNGGYKTLTLRHDNVVAITSITPILTGATAVTLTDLQDPPSRSGIVRSISGQPISSGPLVVEYVAGRIEIPDELIEAALIIVKHLWETQRGPGRPSVLGQQSTQGGETTFLPVMGFAIPNRAMDLMNLHPAAGLPVGSA